MFSLGSRLRQWVIGAPLNPFSERSRHGVMLAAFLAWVGLGADGLSSTAYGPEEAFLALGSHTPLALFLALATALTVCLISLAYSQVIELFPGGGGGYRAASRLVGPHAGLVAGAALVIDYVLTIAISIASSMDALFSLLPPQWQWGKVYTGAVLVVVLIILNMRGIKESIYTLLPIFAAFFISHVAIILYGIISHVDGVPKVISNAHEDVTNMAGSLGWVFVAALFLKAYSLGGGTYTGIEAVSNGMNQLKEPRVRTGKVTMVYMATSLSFMAAGTIFLYLLWDAKPVLGQTLNAVVFKQVLEGAGLNPLWVQVGLLFLMGSVAGLLIVAANSGFIAGPNVLSNMAVDSWVPRQFRQLSSRLVTQNGILMMGIAALLVLFWSHGSVKILVILYSINVFLTFSLATLGLCVHWWRSKEAPKRLRRLVIAVVAMLVCVGILCVTVVEKFSEGGWMTLLLTGGLVALCLFIRRHYDETRRQLATTDELFSGEELTEDASAPELDKNAPTAIFLVGKNRGVGMHSLLWVMRLFPNHFKNFIFIAVGEVDRRNFEGEGELTRM